MGDSNVPGWEKSKSKSYHQTLHNRDRKFSLLICSLVKDAASGEHKQPPIFTSVFGRQ